MRRRVEIDDIKKGAELYNDRGDLFTISKVKGERVYFTETHLYSTVAYILSKFTTKDKPTGILTFDGQIGGDHYNKNDPIQFAKDNYPPEHLEGFYRINVDKYMARYDKKNGIEDIKKAKHYIEMLLELKLREKRDAK